VKGRRVAPALGHRQRPQDVVFAKMLPCSAARVGNPRAKDLKIQDMAMKAGRR